MSGQIGAYRLIVASSEKKLDQNVGDRWDTGRVESATTVNVEYAGSSLSSGERCYWKVRAWDNKGNHGDWTQPSTFEMGLLSENDWRGKWIVAPPEESAPLFRKEFGVDAPVNRARLYICGIGWHEAHINGEKVGDHEFDPAPTWYDNTLSFPIGSRVLYVTHDITHMIHTGENAIGVMLGNGWYSSDTGEPPGRLPLAERPILLAQIDITLENGERVRIATGTDWLTHSGPITANDIVSGESYDARLEQPGWTEPGLADRALPGPLSVWASADEADPPSGRLMSQAVEPERITRRFEAKRKLQSGEDSWIFDFGQFMSGWVELVMSGAAGTRVSMRFSGRVNYETTALDSRNSDYSGARHNDIPLSGVQEDSYICKDGGKEVWRPRFTVHGFRYVEVTGYPGEPGLDAVVGCAVNNEIPRSGEFSCSDELLNSIHHNVNWTFRGAFQGIPQDAADRAERPAWLGDPGFVAEDFMFNFRDILFWTKWLDDIADTRREDGSW